MHKTPLRLPALTMATMVIACAPATSACRGVPEPGAPELRVDDADTERSEERDALVALLAHRGVNDARVLEAMRAVPRHRFVLESYQAAAYEDRALPIAANQTISQPYIVAYMSELLELDGSERVLEVGTGSGYQAAVLAELADRVFSIEIVPELSRTAAQALARAGYDGVELRVGDGYLGWPEHAPFDAVIVTAAAPRVPEPLVEQLAPGGRLVLPVEGAAGMQWIWIVDKDAAGIVTRRRTIPVRFVDMTGDVTE